MILLCFRTAFTLPLYDKKPNLFTFATSELSQDAFLAWLCSWAAPELDQLDDKLNKCAQSFIKLLFDQCKKDCPDIHSVRILRQHHKIDVLCIVNEEFYIIIEDKTNTKEHGKQLQRYYDTINVEQNIKTGNILPVYLKTSDQSSYHSVREQGYTPITRAEILPILQSYQGSNPILCDFREYIEEIEDSYKQYKTAIKGSAVWGKFNTWFGFYQEIQKRLLREGVISASPHDHADTTKDHWYIVNAISGAFAAFIWGGGDMRDEQGSNGCTFLLLQQDKLTFKAGWASREPREQYLKAHHALLAQSPIKSSTGVELKIVKPSRMKLSGQSATLAIIQGGYLQYREDGTLDIDKTYTIIKELTEFTNAQEWWKASKTDAI